MAIRDRFVSEAGVIAGADSLALRTKRSGSIWRGHGRSSPAEQKRRAFADSAPC